MKRKLLKIVLVGLIIAFLGLFWAENIATQNYEFMGIAVLIYSIFMALTIAFLGMSKNRLWLGIALAVIALLNGYLSVVVALIMLFIKPKLGDPKWAF